MVDRPSLPLVVSHVLPVHSVLEITSVEKSVGGTVRVEVGCCEVVEGKLPAIVVVGGSVGRLVVVPSTFKMPLGPRESVEEPLIKGGPPGNSVVLPTTRLLALAEATSPEPIVKIAFAEGSLGDEPPVDAG